MLISIRLIILLKSYGALLNLQIVLHLALFAAPKKDVGELYYPPLHLFIPLFFPLEQVIQ